MTDETAILLDLDGVIADFAGSYHRVAVDVLGLLDDPHEHTLPTRWAFYKDWGWNTNDFHQFYVDNYEEILEGCRITTPRWKAALREVAANDVTPVVCTHRWLGAEHADNITAITRTWLRRNGLGFCDLEVVQGDDAGTAKDDFMADSGYQWMAAVEDNPRNLAFLDAAVNILVRQPWNWPTARWDDYQTTVWPNWLYMDVSATCDTLVALAQNTITKGT